MLIISPYSKKLDGKENAKNFPYWEEVLVSLYAEIEDIEIVQIGLLGEQCLSVHMFYENLTQASLRAMIKNDMDVFMSVDNFFPHMCNYYAPEKRGVVVWSKSSPKIFGYKQNVNLLKSNKYLKQDQFEWWKDEPFDVDAFVSVPAVVKAVEKLYESCKKRN